MKHFISIVLLMAFSNIYAANITVKLDVNPVLVNDTFHLTYTASGSVDDDPDFSAIKNDFELLGTQQSSNMSMINGDINRTKTWRLTLLSKKVGTFTIPAISFGSDRAPEVKVVIKNIISSNTATPNQNFILEMEPSQQSGFVQQQFIITVKLLIAENINSYQFSELTTSNPDTLILPLGKDQQYKTYRGSKQYIVIEKKYALFPQIAETLKLNPFIAAVTMNRQSSSRFYDPFNSRSTSKRLYSKAVNLTVKAIPAQYNSNNWLPSTTVTLNEEWPPNKKIIAGEPITRTLILEADGLTAAQLPEINQPAINGLKQYPDQPDSQEKQTTTGLTSIRNQKIALIPTQAGSYTLPAINVEWWNTKTNKVETAQLAQRSFTVLPAPSNGGIPITSTKQPVDTSVKASASPSPITENTQSDNVNNFWFSISMLFLVLWLATITIWLRSKSNTSQKEEKTTDISKNISSSLNRIKVACKNNNAQETKTALLNWAKFIFSENQPNNLTDIAKQVDEPLKQSITSLNTHLYSPQSSEWNCGDIYEQCKNNKQACSDNKVTKNSAKLEPLNRSN